MPELAITTTALPAGQVKVAYSAALSATGGAPPYVWSVTAGSLPSGLALSPGGVLSGTPTRAGSFTFTIQVTDAAAHTASLAYTLTISTAPGALSITTPTLPDGTVGQPYSATLSATGGTPPYTWAVSQGTLPTGLSLVGATISGIPTQAQDTTFTIQVMDAAGGTATRAYTVAVAPAGGGNDYHVAINGDDTNPGTADLPWRTLQHAAQTARAGDTVHVHTGSYGEDLICEHSGTAASPITFRAAPGGFVDIRSIELRRGVSHLVCDGFRVQGYTVWGVTLFGDNDYVTLRNLVIVGGETGIRMTLGNSGEQPVYGPVSNVTIQDCTVRDAVYTGIDGTPGPCNNLVIRRCEVSNCGLGGQASYGSDGIGIETGQNITIENCNSHDNSGDGIDLNSRDITGNVPGIVVRNNTVVRNFRNGIKVWAGGLVQGNVLWGMGSGPLVVGAYNATAQVIANTIAYNMCDATFSERGYSVTVGYPENPPAVPRVSLTLRSNIIAFNTGPAVGAPTGIYLGPLVTLVDERNNVFFSREDNEIQADFISEGREVTRAEIASGVWAALTGQGQNDLAVDPLFVSGWPNVDLHLQPGSPAAGRGAY